MKNLFILTIFTLTCIIALNAQKKLDFKTFPVTEIYMGSNAPVKITKSNYSFRTRIREAAKNEHVNFAGHYIFTEIGCGAGFGTILPMFATLIVQPMFIKNALYSM